MQAWASGSPILPVVFIPYDFRGPEQLAEHSGPCPGGFWGAHCTEFLVSLRP